MRVLVDKSRLATRRKRALPAMEASYRLLFEGNPQAMYVYGIESLAILAVNQAAIEQYGYSRDEFLRMTIRDLTPAQDLPALLKRVARRTFGLHRTGDWKHVKKNGEVIDVEIATHDLEWAGSSARLVLASDITQRKRAEERFRKSEDSYRRLVEQSPDAMMVHRQEKIIFANASCVSLFGARSADELLSKDFLELVHPDDREVIRERIQAGNISQPRLRVERKFNTLRGQEIEVELMVSHLIYEGEPATQLIFRDISERKKAETKLRLSEASLATAQRIAHLGNWEQDLLNEADLGVQPMRWSDEVFRMFGMEPTRTEMARNVFLRALHPEDKERVQRAMLAAVREKKPINHDYRIILRDGRERVLHSEGYIVCHEKTQKPSKVVGIVQDITERKRAEEELLRLATIVRSSNDAIISVNSEGLITTWNSGAERMFGYPANEAIGQPATLCVPEDLQSEYAAIRSKIVSGEGIAGLETTRRRKDGSLLQVSITVTPILDSKGELITSSAIMRDITERKKSEERFQIAFNTTPEPMTIATIPEGRYVDVNESFLRVTGYQRDEVIGRTTSELQFWDSPEERLKFLDLLEKDGAVRDLEITYRTKSGEPRTAVDSAELIEIAGEKCAIAIFKDVTEQKLLEKQYRQSQKMEAIGRLSGGVAHDFNNLLGVIIGYTELLETQLADGSSLKKNAGEIKKAAQRAASLTRQLLAFSRQQVLQPTVLNLNTIAADMEKMLRRLIGEDIQLTVSLAPDLGRVKADQGQIEQIIMNLAVNSRDAMEAGGKLIIETKNEDLDEEYAAHHPPTVPGRYVMLSVSDTGTGMDAETQGHIFEPFFTTKEQGKGTGLGLATVYGVVKQSGGYIWVYSEPGLGTTFKIFLPRVEEGIKSSQPGELAGVSNRRTETILLVEDEESLRDLTRMQLEQQGYTVLQAARPAEAAEIIRRHRGPIHLLLTDMVMPEMNGTALAQELTAIRPEMKVVFMSGYSAFNHKRELDPDAIFLSKPITRDALLRKLQEALNSTTELSPVKASR